MGGQPHAEDRFHHRPRLCDGLGARGPGHCLHGPAWCRVHCQHAAGRRRRLQQLPEDARRDVPARPHQLPATRQQEELEQGPRAEGRWPALCLRRRGGPGRPQGGGRRRRQEEGVRGVQDRNGVDDDRLPPPPARLPPKVIRHLRRPQGDGRLQGRACPGLRHALLQEVVLLPRRAAALLPGRQRALLRLRVRRPDGGGCVARPQRHGPRALRAHVRLLRPDRLGGHHARAPHVEQVSQDVARGRRAHVPPRRPDDHAPRPRGAADQPPGPLRHL
mmetsp:Transcript_15879/g.43062  ORF Transcript_15879/g.43062 Transcript_15879/m.43062 type:complete len:275 (-) Transcript_15879:1200-2024(-)